MKRALVITTAYPPVAESHTIRVVCLLQGLLRSGFQVRVVTPRAIPTGAEPIIAPPEIGVRRTPLCPYEAVQTKLRSIPAIGQTLARAVGLVLPYLLAPDMHAGWQRVARTAAEEEVRAFSPSIILSCSGSFTAHLLARRLSAQFGIPWVAELGDPWFLNPLPPACTVLVRNVNRWLESRSIPFASSVVVTNQATAGAYRQWLGERLPPCHVVPPVFPKSTLDGTLRPSGASILMAHVGTLNRSSRSLIPLLEGISALPERIRSRLRLRIVGSSPRAFKQLAARQHPGMVEFTGWVGYEEACRQTQQASILLLYGNLGSLQIPAKTYAYVETDVPILYIGSMPTHLDPTWTFLKQFPGVTYASNTAPSLGETLERLEGILPGLTASAQHRSLAAVTNGYDSTLVADQFAQIVASNATPA